MNVATRNNRNISTNVSPTPAKATDSHKKGGFVRSLIAVALAEALMIGSAFAGTTPPVTSSTDIVLTDSDKDTDGDKASSDTSLHDTFVQALTTGTPAGGSIGTMDVSDPTIAIEGTRGPNNASLNGADPTTTTALAMGVSSNASGGNTVAVGVQAVAGSDNAVALGSRVSTGADQPYSVAVGSNANTNGAQAVALGSNTQANADNAVAVGTNNTAAVGQSSIAMGDGALVSRGAVNSIALGTSASVARDVTDAMAMGPNSSVVAGAYGSIALGSGSIANRANVLSIGAPGAERQITNVAAGTQLTDAVNVSQLNGLKDQVNNIDNRVTNIENSTGTTPTPTPTPSPGDGSWNKDAQGDKVVNVGDGAVNAGSKDAVNGSQLANTAQSTANALGGGSTVNADGSITMPTYTVGGQQVRGVEGAVNQLDQRINGMQGQIDGLQGQLNKTARGAYSGIAGVTALTMIPGVDVGKTVAIGAGVGNYKGYTAAALGGEARINENWKVRAGVSLSSSGNTVGVGASYQW
ncbi:MAG TPA: YadA-like family protein [Dyella sp.]|uniref:YadA-like family protein n=1 Tax=Dyella sp. TaxID=1869338 RepID=UPI002D0DC14A|nr:YadA-like family protein [Dyella sp.]HTV86651.1 YadA-like family protein [Dyella sp.]